jgi:FMN phosphatase YigB (HAD superfamily)
MIKAVLFDLDDTLLGNEVDTFMKQYFALLGDYARPYLDRQQFLACLVQSTRATIANVDPALSNADVFWATFEALTQLRRAEMEPFFVGFYEREFPRLRSATRVRPEAEPLVSRAFEAGLQVVIATNPLFPRTAIEQRLAWAGVPVDRYPYALVTTYENMHAAKPQPAYYREILDTLDVEPGEAIMVGDDWGNDIVPAAGLGLATYWVAPDGAAPPAPLARGHGSLADLQRLLDDGWLERLAS